MQAYQEGSDELTVTFQPPLFLQRRGWVFDILRRESVSEVLDVGCGEGSLISCLCNPAPWLSLPPTSILEAFATPLSESPDNNILADVSAQRYLECAPEVFLHPSKVIGLDISLVDLEYAIQATAPTDWQTRWEPLEAQIWEGGLEVVNPTFIGVECIVATEVVEHLPEDILQYFAPILLGAYHPRLLLITTPSYTFNARFTAPDAPRTARSGYPDPTKRTDRIFRHHDHKFEWTPEEFADWCAAVADTWGYDIEVGGVGRAVEKDEWERDEVLGYASQVAAFKRRDDEGWGERRRLFCELTRETQGCSKGQHKLLVTHRHLAHEKARRPLPLRERGEVIKCAMTDLRDSPMRLGDLWWEERVAAACGGWTELMAAAIAHHAELRLENSKELSMSDWTVELRDGLPPDEPGSERGELRENAQESPILSSSSDEFDVLATPSEDDMQPLDSGTSCEDELTAQWPQDRSNSWGNTDDENEGWDVGENGWVGSLTEATW
ncbi:hypothetical protein DAEQUDRAFT_703337 [Daedalea quercina L-15889]|uniref:Small RNA 2'-O-methyltransferase n=1 Tax=Daedalea quercina L-15889 TaxID=1314783 RepID=A0A165TLL1_9APHY|nr:hypothetical protein DAEQUDRAFT_703337 [Daedalea quercina L-15889]